jgi:DNA-binding GntR family transcriptional regulator
MMPAPSSDMASPTRLRGRRRPVAAGAPRPPGARAFLYDDLAHELRRRVSGGVYAPGGAIPSEAELVREFGVSAITVRRAIRELTVEGVVVGRQGRGVFVVDRRRIERQLRGDARTSMRDEIRRAGLEPAVKELAWEPRTDPAAAARLGLPRREPLIRHEKLVLASGEPVSIDRVDLPRPLGERLRDELVSDFVFPLLARHGIAVGRTELRFEGGAVSEADAALLGLPPRAPLILVHYTLFTPAGRPILTGMTTARSDRFVFALTLAGQPGAGRAAAGGGARSRPRPSRR